MAKKKRRGKGKAAAREFRNDRWSARTARDAAYRKALGLEDGAKLPKEIGTVEGHGGAAPRGRARTVRQSSWSRSKSGRDR